MRLVFAAAAALVLLALTPQEASASLMLQQAEAPAAESAWRQAPGRCVRHGIRDNRRVIFSSRDCGAMAVSDVSERPCRRGYGRRGRLWLSDRCRTSGET